MCCRLRPILQNEPLWRASALNCRTLLIDHERGHLLEERAEELLDFRRQSRVCKRFVHQLHPAIAGALVNPKWIMSRPQSRMSALFDISLRTSKSVDQEISKAVLGGGELTRRIHPPQNVVLRDLTIKCRDKAREAFFADDSVNAGFVH